MKPLVTALIDTYNHEKYIEQALVSVVGQGLSPSELEIVVVDDGSTDGTPSIIEKFAPRVRHLRKKNGGQASAFNAAFPEVNGQIVATLDGDDWWAEGKLAPVLDAFERNPEVSAVSHAYYQFFERTKELTRCGPSETTFVSLRTPEAARSALDQWAFLVMGALSVRRTLLERVFPIPEVLVFSADSPIALGSMAMGTLVLPNPLSYYRIHSNNLYAEGSNDDTRMRRRYEMDDLMFGLLRPMLLRLGVNAECVSAFIDPAWIGVNRHCLRTFGGSRLKTLRTEMLEFRWMCKNPTFSYRLFKYLVTCSATLALPPRLFYRARDWYASHGLYRFRDWIFGTDATTVKGKPARHS